MQPSLESKVRAAVMQQGGGTYVQREAGEALYVEGEDADSIVLLVQGQVGGMEGGIWGGG